MPPPPIPMLPTSSDNVVATGEGGKSLCEILVLVPSLHGARRGHSGRAERRKEERHEKQKFSHECGEGK